MHCSGDFLERVGVGLVRLSCFLYVRSCYRFAEECCLSVEVVLLVVFHNVQCFAFL